MHLPKWVTRILTLLGTEETQETTWQDWRDTPADQPHVNAQCYSFGLNPEDARFRNFADGSRSYRDVELLDPKHADNSRWSNGAPLIMRRIDDQPGGLTVFEVVRYLLTEERVRATTKRIEIGSHEMVFKDAHGYPIVRFYAAGRKMHYNSAHRASNAVAIIRHYFGQIEGVDIESVALPDVQHFYPPLVLTDGANGWMTSDGQPVRA